jgi:phosphate transport system substrate-binding protein
MHRRPLLTRVLPLLVAAAALASCGRDRTVDGGPAELRDAGRRGSPVTLAGAGATLPLPLYARWFDAHARAHAVRIDYQARGSGAGIHQAAAGIVDFGATDVPMTDEEADRRPDLLHVPTVVGAVALAYHLPGFTGTLNLDAEVTAAVYLGRITRWDDERIAALNPGAQLPGSLIVPVAREDASGTGRVLADYLHAASAEWRESIGAGAGVGGEGARIARGSEGVAREVARTPGALGYLGVAHAASANLPTAALRNASGAFVAPSPGAVRAAAAGADRRLDRRADLRLDRPEPVEPDAYPLVSFTYLLIPGHLEDCDRAAALVGLIRWALVEGSVAVEASGYAPLPERIRERVLRRLQGITCGDDRGPVPR